MGERKVVFSERNTGFSQKAQSLRAWRHSGFAGYSVGTTLVLGWRAAGTDAAIGGEGGSRQLGLFPRFRTTIRRSLNRIMNTKDLIRLGVPPGEATRRGM